MGASSVIWNPKTGPQTALLGKMPVNDQTWRIELRVVVYEGGK